MKKLIALILVLLMCAMCISSCISSEKTGDDSTNTGDTSLIPAPDANATVPEETTSILDTLQLNRQEMAVIKTLSRMYQNNNISENYPVGSITDGASFDVSMKLDETYLESAESVDIKFSGAVNNNTIGIKGVASNGKQSYDISVVLDQNNIAASSETLTADKWYGINLKTVVDDMDKSIFAPGNGTGKYTIPSEYYDMFKNILNDVIPQLTGELKEETVKTLKSFSDICNNLTSGIKSSESKETISYEGKDAEAVVVTVTFNKVDMEEILIKFEKEYRDNKNFKDLIDSMTKIFAFVPKIGDFDFIAIINQIKSGLLGYEFSLTTKYFIVDEYLAKIDVTCEVTNNTSESAQNFKNNKIKLNSTIEFATNGNISVRIVPEMAEADDAAAVITYSRSKSGSVYTYEINAYLESKTGNETALKVTATYDSSNGKWDLSAVDKHDTPVKISGTYKFTTNSITFTVDAINYVEVTYEYYYDESTNEYKQNETRTENNINPEFTITITYGKKDVTIPEYTNILKMSEAEMEKLAEDLKKIVIENDNQVISPEE